MSTEAAPPTPEVAYVVFEGYITITSAQEILGHMNDLAARGIPRVVLAMLTPGGQSEPGLDLYDALRAMPFQLATHAVGTVESLGVAVYLAGDERLIGPQATLMVHESRIVVPQPTGIPLSEARQRVTEMEADDARERAILVDRTPLDDAQARTLVEAETRWDAQSAVAAGLATEVKGFAVEPPTAPRLSVAGGPLPGWGPFNYRIA
jgi:ATP-dependent Clp protease protease subunit